MDNGNGSVRPQQPLATDDLSVQIRWPQTQDEPIAATKPGPSPVPTSPPGPSASAPGQVDADRGSAAPPGRSPQVDRLVVSVSRIASQVEALSASHAAFCAVVTDRLGAQQEDTTCAAASAVEALRASSGTEDPRIGALIDQVGLLVEAQLSQTRCLDRLAAEQVELATEVRAALARAQEELRLLRRRIALRGRVDGGAADGAARADAAGPDARPRRGPTSKS